ncbi:hypothetical protein [Aquimarina aquimarini]|uniref:hypothetical protein n=1 Tax=Aquimarina aquimarini TaxID=1191734 RepID=UPI000D55836A|nr:hypothetical protein [Aquimarina aquimarini]
MNKKINSLIILIIFLLNCKKQHEHFENEINTSLKNEKSSIREAINKDLDKKMLPDSTSLKLLEMKRHIEVIDLDRDKLLDGVVFLSAFRKKNNSFMQTAIIHYDNNGKEMCLISAITSNSLVFPIQDNEDSTVVYKKNHINTKEIEPDNSGKLDSSKTRSGYIELNKGQLIYKKVTGWDHYDRNNTLRISRVDHHKYVTAKNGLIYRDEPDGKALGTFPFETMVHIIGKTGWKKTIYDTDFKGDIEGEWVQVNINEYSDETAFVFDGFLSEEINLKPNAVFRITDEKGIILPGNYSVYNEALTKTKQIKVQEIEEVSILRKTEQKRPNKRGQDYCEWSNYVEVLYKEEPLIIFGEKLLSISSEKEYKLDNYNIDLITGENFTMGAADENGLTGCDDYSDIIIKANATYSFLFEDNSKSDVAKVFYHDEGMFEDIKQAYVKNDTLVAQISQSFQEGTGKYTLKIFYDEGWKYLESENARSYE